MNKSTVNGYSTPMETSPTPISHNQSISNITPIKLTKVIPSYHFSRNTLNNPTPDCSSVVLNISKVNKSLKASTEKQNISTELSSKKSFLPLIGL